MYNLRPVETPPSRRERKKEQIRRSLLEAANRMFRERGFEATTIEQLCEEVDISRRTFFRYFPDKGALLFPNRGERLDRFLTFLEAAPKGESPYDTLRRAARLFAREYHANRDDIIAQQRVIQTSADLQAREREIDRDWELAMAATFVERAGVTSPAAVLRARIIAGASMGVIRATMRHWYERDGQDDLGDLGLEKASAAAVEFFLMRASSSCRVTRV